MASRSATRLSEEMKKAGTEGRKRKSYHSFGDDGLTATVSASGSLLRITQHFPEGKQGFCVDHPGMPQPFMVEERLKELLSLSKTPSWRKVIGPHIGDSLGSGPPTQYSVNDRWPAFHQKLKTGADLKIQYIASKGTVYQIFELSEGGNENLPPLTVTPNLLIRRLDYVDDKNEFNQDPPNSANYSYQIQGNCIIREHRTGDAKVRLHIWALQEKLPLKFVRYRRSKIDTLNSSKGNPAVTGAVSIDLANEGPANEDLVNNDPANDDPINESPVNDESTVRTGASRSFYQVSLQSAPPCGEKCTIVLAYRLEYLSNKTAPQLPNVTWAIASKAKVELLKPWPSHRLVGNEALNFFLKRNLEHVLSVSSVPVSNTETDGIPHIAITTGDVDGHRVATAASFYAFQILLLALDHFIAEHSKQQLPEDWACECKTQLPTPYICVMKQRIERVCRGHIKWLLQKAYKPGHHFRPPYWVDGSKIARGNHKHCNARKSLVDTPFELIKIADFYNHFKGETPQTKPIKSIVDSWIRELDRRDERGAYAFHRYDKGEATRTFYLTDHVLIWQALQSSENLGIRISSKRDYSSTCFQRNILERFTTQNPLSKLWTIAVRRGPTHTRFLLRSKDSTLFRAMEMGLFDKSGTASSSISRSESNPWQNKIDTWKNTIKCQMHHERNDDTLWEDPQRFILAIIVVRNLGKPINLRPRQEMCERAISLLFSRSSANGLFPGKLDKHQEPTSNSLRMAQTSYWGNTFEVPYLLWKYCSNLDDERDANWNPDARSPDNMLGDEFQFQSPVRNDFLDFLREASRQMRSKEPEHPTGYSMTHRIPFNNTMDENNVVELQDEWLYNMPAFFLRPTKIESNGIGKGQARTSIGSRESATAGETNTTSRFQGIKMDFRNSKEKRSIQVLSSKRITTTKKIDEIMAKGRSPESAKKRIWLFLSSHPSNNRVVLSTVSEREIAEKKALQEFFNRHEATNDFFREKTKAKFNTWETEVHLSYHDLVEKEQKSDTANIPASRKVDEPTVIFSALKEGYGDVCLKKSVMSFRIEGDFFDRYWTCRILSADTKWRMPDPWGEDGKSILENFDEEDGNYAENVNAEDELSDETSGDEGSVKRQALRYPFFEQRRILELNLFATIIEEMNTKADAYLEAMKQLVDSGKVNLGKSFDRVQRGASSTWRDDAAGLDYKSFVTESKRFRAYQNSLQHGLRILDAQFTENMATIDLWLNREKARDAERPRWSFNDESRYRARILKETARGDRSIQAFRNNHNNVLKLMKSATKDLELMRSYLDIMQIEIDMRGSDDIKHFTYVTVVFLPLGFATGLYSMSEAPSHSTLVSMIVTAFVTLAITVAVLIVVRIVDFPRITRRVWRRVGEWDIWNLPWRKPEQQGKTHSQEQKDEGPCVEGSRTHKGSVWVSIRRRINRKDSNVEGKERSQSDVESRG